MGMEMQQDATSQGSDWAKYEKLVMATQERHEGYFKEIIGQVDDVKHHVTNLENRLTVHLVEQRTKQRISASIWGAAAGLFVMLVSLAAQYFLR